MTVCKTTFRRLSLVSTLVAASVLVGCAPQPDDIEPQMVSDLQYLDYSCPDLVKEQVHIDSTLGRLSTEQWQTRVDDVYGYIFLLTPLGRVAGRDMESEIALYKGEREAVGRMTIAKSCSHFS
jgi:hypothetical protein